MSFHSGWDAFSPSPGTVDKMFCKVCEAEMNVQRNVNGPTSSMEAMGQRKHLHDSFTCGHAEEDWHIQARCLRKKIEEEVSQKLTDLLAEELNLVLSQKFPTKHMNWKYK
jgi:hypothetical protein